MEILSSTEVKFISPKRERNHQSPKIMEGWFLSLSISLPEGKLADHLQGIKTEHIVRVIKPDKKLGKLRPT